MSWLLPLLGFIFLLVVGGHVSDWLDSRIKGGRQAIKDLAKANAFIDGLEEQAREFRNIDNFADITVQEIANFRAPKKEIRK